VIINDVIDERGCSIASKASAVVETSDDGD